ncbi:MAG: phosphotransferase, partial [Candidatus Latescibacteria bacterium]|nr:phosphotransferase [Candidatus Latescibacterota bacterium]
LTVGILAEGLRAIHRVEIEKCPFPDCSADALISNVEHNIAKGIVTAEVLAEYNDSRTLDEALAEARSTKPEFEDLVLTHGDYCLPNIMIDNGALSGFIDWGSVGIGGRHRDFAAVEYSVRRNFGAEWVEPFFDAYGQKYFDEDIMAFYRAIYDLI